MPPPPGYSAGNAGIPPHSQVHTQHCLRAAIQEQPTAGIFPNPAIPVKPQLPLPCAQVWSCPSPGEAQRDWQCPAQGGKSPQPAAHAGNSRVYFPNTNSTFWEWPNPECSSHSLSLALNCWRPNQNNQPKSHTSLITKNITCVTSNCPNRHTPRFWSVKGLHTSIGKSSQASCVPGRGISVK